MSNSKRFYAESATVLKAVKQDMEIGALERFEPVGRPPFLPVRFQTQSMVVGKPTEQFPGGKPRTTGHGIRYER